MLPPAWAFRYPWGIVEAGDHASNDIVDIGESRRILPWLKIGIGSPANIPA